MKIVEIAFVILVFNFCIGAASHAGITQHPVYYESSVIDKFQPVTYPNISTSSETEQYTITMDMVGLIFSVTDFGWLYLLVPQWLHNDAFYYISTLQAIVFFFYVVAFIELFTKREGIMGSSSQGSSG